MQDLDPADYEIIIVDDAASDDTRRQVQRWADRACASDPGASPCAYSEQVSSAPTTPGDARPGHTIRYIPVTGSHGPAVARNLGWRAARGEIIAFTDDDCIPTPGWLRAGLSACVDGVVAVSGKIIVPLDGVPTDYEHNASHLEKTAFVTANCFYRRDILELLGGFDERFTAAWREDSDLFFTLLEHIERCGGEAPPPAYHGRGTPCGYPGAVAVDGPGTDVGVVHLPKAAVVHPVRPAPWGISLKQQRKSMFNALLYKKHPALYRQKIQVAPPWHYYCILVALIVGFVAALTGFWLLALAAFCLWLCMTGRFCLQRLRHTSHAPSHVMEMIVTSILIPPLAIFWRIVGAFKFRVFFL